MSDRTVDVNIYLPFVKVLIEKYGNFKVSQELHNYILEKLADICEMIEIQNKEKK